MKIGILGYGKEGQSAAVYFKQKGSTVEVIDNFTDQDLMQRDFSHFDLVLRSPSVRPRPEFSSMTKYFFDHCPCPIIGVTGTKGKGTTCSIITALLKALHQDVYLVGNIGNPALDVLDALAPSSIVVYEMSSFQLWDLHKSPHIAVVLGIEPDHLNVHHDYTEYVNAKANIAKHQRPEDFCIYYHNNPDATAIAKQSPAHKITYPIANDLLTDVVSHLGIPGQHNCENAQAALLAVSSFYKVPFDQFLTEHRDNIIQALAAFRGLPHRLQFLRELNGIKYYDDNFSTTPTSLKVALEAFPTQKLILIAGGRDKTGYQDLAEILELIHHHPNLQKVILIGESGRELVESLPDAILANTLAEAVQLATQSAQKLHAEIVLMSPAAASFDMFDSVYDRGAKFQKLIQDLT